MKDQIQEIQVACVRMDEGLYAVDIMRIKEILRMPRLSPLPRALPFVEGVINLRGTVIPAVDLRKRFGLPPADSRENSRLLIISVGGQALGLIVDEVTEMISVPVKEIKAPPKGVRVVGGEFLVGLCLVQEVPVMLLNIDALLTFSEQVSLEEISSVALPPPVTGAEA